MFNSKTSCDENSGREKIVQLLLIFVTLAIYWQVHSHSFLNYDDDVYVYENENIQSGFTWSAIQWAFTSGYAANWHPVTWLSHMLDFSMFGLHAGNQLLVNLLFHIVNSLILFRVLKLMTGAFWPAAFAAMLFAWHPTHVESVAWISERKDVLSALFFLLALLSYLSYVKKPGVPRYALVLVLFALGLMSKPMLVTFPFVLLLLDFWPLNRLRTASTGKQTPQPETPIGRLLVEKIPFFALSLASCWITYAVQSKAGATQSLGFSFKSQAMNAGIAYGRYLGEIFCPVNLAVFYPFFDPPSLWQFAISATIIAIITILALKILRSQPYVLVGWLWFLGTLVPVIGLVQVGAQSMADRYTYIPSIGIFIVVAWLLDGLAVSKPAMTKPLSVLAAIALAFCAVMSFRQTAHWKDSESLFSHTLSVTTRNATANVNLGEALMEKKRYDEALVFLNNALAIDPRRSEAYDNLGICLEKLGRSSDAVTNFEKNLAINPGDYISHYNEAESLMTLKNLDSALGHYLESIRLSPDFVKSHFELGALYLKQNELTKARQEFEIAARLKPRSSLAHTKLGNTMGALGDTAGAAREYETAIALAVTNAEALNNLAWIRAANADPALRNGTEAVRLAEKACAISKEKEPLLIGTLAAAYAEAGRFAEAFETAKKARDLALASGQKQTAEANERLLKLYESGRAYHEEPPSTIPAK